MDGHTIQQCPWVGASASIEHSLTTPVAIASCHVARDRAQKTFIMGKQVALSLWYNTRTQRNGDGDQKFITTVVQSEHIICLQ